MLLNQSVKSASPGKRFLEGWICLICQDDGGISAVWCPSQQLKKKHHRWLKYILHLLHYRQLSSNIFLENHSLFLVFNDTFLDKEQHVWSSWMYCGTNDGWTTPNLASFKTASLVLVFFLGSKMISLIATCLYANKPIGQCWKAYGA